MTRKIAIAATILVGSALHAAALEGRDGDNNAVPGAASSTGSAWARSSAPHDSYAYARAHDRTVRAKTRTDRRD